MFPHHKVDEQPNKKPKKGYHSHKRRENDDKNAVATVKMVPQLGCVSQDSDALVSQRGETRCKKSWDRFEKNGSLSLRFVKASIREKKGPSLGKIQVKHPHQRSPYTMKFEDRSHSSDVPEARLGTLTETYTSSKRKTKLHLDSGASMRVVSKRDLDSAELETMRTSRSPTTVMTANGEVQTREEAAENVKELDIFFTVMLLEESPAVLSLGKLCEDHGYTYHWTSGHKTTSLPKWQLN